MLDYIALFAIHPDSIHSKSANNTKYLIIAVDILCLATIFVFMKTATDKIKKQIIQVINKIIFKEKRKIFKFKGVSLYPSEVHLLLVIKNDIDTNATEIARQLGLTKGAVSQTLLRLEKKGIIVKTKDPYNKNELTLSLTGLGETAYELCESSQASFVKAHEGYLAKLDSEEKEVILNFLFHMEKAIDDL